MLINKNTLFVIAASLMSAISTADNHHRFYSPKNTNQANSFEEKTNIKKNNHRILFAAIGDGPYGDDKEAAYDVLIDDINRNREIDFVFHVGDIKSGGSECSNERLNRRFEQLQNIKTALIYTPGDNEWTDCHRASNGSWNPLERLDYIRNLFYPDPNLTTGQRPFAVISQANIPNYEQFVENVFFMRNQIAFSTIHIVGSNNNLKPWSGIDDTDSLKTPRADRIHEYEMRNNASLHWLETTFQRAQKQRAAGVFIAIHADPNFDLAPVDPKRNGFNPFLAKLFELTNTFDRPVVIAHGDSHVYRVDTPRLTPWYHNGDAKDASNNPLTPKLSRLEVFGDSDLHWVKVTADPKSKAVFSFTPQLVNKNIND